MFWIRTIIWVAINYDWIEVLIYVYCNIPREYYKKIIIKENNYINSRLDKNFNAGKFNFIKARAKTYNINSQMLQVPIFRVYNKDVK